MEAAMPFVSIKSQVAYTACLLKPTVDYRVWCLGNEHRIPRITKALHLRLWSV
jgi:hypothetical protein